MSKANKPDAELQQFMDDLEASIQQAQRGEHAAVHTPEQIMARRRGRPVLENPKEPVKLRLDADLLAALRATGDGWQTRINDTLRANMVLAGKL